MQKKDRQGRALVSTKQKGDAAEDLALAYLQAQGLRLVARNYRTPGRGGGEIDLILCDPQATLVFVEVRLRSRTEQGGALASVTASKQRRIVLAARYFLARLATWPACRFDVVALEPGSVQWIQAAFEAPS